METKKPNFIFFGTPDVASETLEILKHSGFLPTLIVTSPDRPQGRKMLMTPTETKVWAQQNKIPFLQPEVFDQEFISKLKDMEADLFIVVAYGKILPKSILNMPKLGSINIHYSLLPKYRGASPVESAILNGDNETGIAIQQMEYKMDAGPILALEKVPILNTETSPELRKRLIKIGGDLLVKLLKTPSFLPLTKGEVPKTVGVIQDESQATYCTKIKKEDGLIDLDADGAKNYNKFRAYISWPRTFFFENNKRIIITDAELANGKFIIKKVLPEGKKEMQYEDFLRPNTLK